MNLSVLLELSLKANTFSGELQPVVGWNNDPHTGDSGFIFVKWLSQINIYEPIFSKGNNLFI